MIDYPFAYEKLAAGESILGRTHEINQFVQAVCDRGRGVAIYDTPQSGKETVVREGIDVIKKRGLKFLICELNLFNIRTYEDFVKLFRSKMIDLSREANKGALLTFDIDIDTLTDKKVLELPQVIAQESGNELIMYFKEFQNLLFIESEEDLLGGLEKIWSRQHNVRYVITGSRVNAMKAIFEEKKLFSSMTTVIELSPIDRREIGRYITTSFMNFGRVIEMEEAMEICSIASCRMNYVKQLCATCFSQPAGYINRKIVLQARDKLICSLSPYFRQIMTDLTVNQISFLKAVTDGVEKFSSAEIMDLYKLNSSANVFRIKDALKKKEVITFDSEDRPKILDTMFEYWLKHYYFVNL